MSKNTRYFLLILACLIGFGLRLYQLDAVALRGDEAFSVQRWTAAPLAISLTEIAAIEPHPPLTYGLFRAWGLIFGTQSEFALRMLPVLFNMFGIPALYALGKRLTNNPTVAILGASLWAIHPFEIWHAQDFRNYGVWAGLSAVTLYLALRVILSERRKVTDWVRYALVASLSCLIFYNELITIGVLGLYVLLACWRDIKFVVQWSALNLAIILLTIAAFFIFQGDLVTSGTYGGTTGGFDIMQLWQRFLPVLSFGDTLSVTLQQQFNPFTVHWGLIVVLSMAILAIVVVLRPQEGLFLGMLAIVPLITLSLISMRLSIFRPRYIMLGVPAYILLVSYATVLLWRGNRSKIFAIGLLGIWGGFSMVSLNNYYHVAAYQKAPDWRDLIMYLETETDANEVIIQTGVDASFGLYYDNATIPAGEFALPADVTQPIADVIATMEATSENYHTLWIVGQTFPDWQNAGVVEDWAFSHLQLVRETRIAGLPVRQFMQWAVLPDETQNEALATYGDAIDLMGVEVLTQEPTNELTVWLYWRPVQPTDNPLTVFVHLVGGINPATGSPLWSQDDHPPQNGRVTTDLWQVNTVYRDVFTLPLDGVIRGDYTLQIGFYDPQTNTRLLREDESDAFVVEDIMID